MSALPQYADTGPRLAAGRSPAVVSASDLVRRYGEGDAHVDALRGVSLEIEEGCQTAIMGPSGLGQVDVDAHPRRARQADGGQRLDRRLGDLLDERP
jgi:hypothetical protein